MELSSRCCGDPHSFVYRFCAALYDGLKSCPQEKHIHVLCDTDFIAHLIGRAEPEIAGGLVLFFGSSALHSPLLSSCPCPCPAAPAPAPAPAPAQLCSALLAWLELLPVPFLSSTCFLNMTSLSVLTYPTEEERDMPRH